MTPVEQIMDAVGARLAIMKRVNGYTQDVNRIRRATLKPFATDDLPAVHYWPGPDTQLTKGAGWVERQLTVSVEYYDRTRDKPFTDLCFELGFDVAVAMLRSPTTPQVAAAPDLTLGGLVRSSQLDSITPQVGEGQSPWCGVFLVYSFVYRVSASNPLTLIPS